MTRYEIIDIRIDEAAQDKALRIARMLIACGWSQEEAVKEAVTYVNLRPMDADYVARIMRTQARMRRR